MSLPSVNHAWFDGIPLDSPIEYLAALIALSAAFGGYAAAALRRQFGPHRLRWIGGAAAVAILLKLALLGVGEHAGFAACYATPLRSPSSSACERSWQFPFSNWTRFDRSLDFSEDTWNLSFVNSLRFNYFRAGQPYRNWLPLSVTWKGRLDPSVERLEVEYTGEAAVQAGNRSIILPPKYGEVGRATVELPRQSATSLRIAYHFDDAARAGQPVRHPYATFRVLAARQNGLSPDLALRPPLAQVIATVFADVLIIGILAAFVLSYGRMMVDRRNRWLSAALLGGVLAMAALLVSGNTHLQPLVLAACALLVLFAMSLPGSWRRFWLGWPVLAAMLLLMGDLGAPGYTAVTIAEGGNDPLTYESFARDILESRSLRAGENAFFYQALYRYIRFGEHLIFGDGQPLITMAAVAALIGAALWAYGRLRPPRRSSWWIRTTAWIAGAAAIVLVTSRPVGAAVAVGISEYPTWILLPLVIGGLFGGTRDVIPLWVLVGAALSVLTRMNQLPGAAALLAVGALLTRRPWASVARAGLVVGLLAFVLPAWHNYHYGGVVAFMPLSSSIPENVIIRPHELLHPQAEVLRRLSTQVRGIAGLSNGMVRETVLFWICCAAWLLTWIVLLGRKQVSARVAAVMVAPLMYLAPHIIYLVGNRMVYAGYLAMTWASLAAIRLACGPVTPASSGELSSSTLAHHGPAKPGGAVVKSSLARSG